ncbi:MAG: hypothetical protein U0794_00020 [Isosphaeraceae bacterium]
MAAVLLRDVTAAGVPDQVVASTIKSAILLPDGAGAGDGDLLDCFIERHDEAIEVQEPFRGWDMRRHLDE